MLKNFLQLLKSLHRAIRSLWSRTPRKVGQKPTENWYPYLLEVKSPDGICLTFVLLVRASRLSVDAQVDRSHWKTCSDLPSVLLRRVLVANSPLLNATTLSVRLQRLSLSEESVDRLLSRFPISRTSGCVMLRWGSGGWKIHNAH